MRKNLSIVTLACAAAFALGACDKTEQPQQAVEQAPVVLAAPKLAAPVAPVEPAELASAEQAAATAPSAAGGDTTKPAPVALDPALAETKAKYDAAMAQYDVEKKAYATAWKQYLVSVVTANMNGVKSNHPYMYFVPGGDDDAAKADRNNQLGNVTGIVSRGVLPGNMLAFGGPDSAITAQLVADAFKDVQTGSFKGVVVLFVGAQANFSRVKEALAQSGADVRFVEAK